MHSADEGGQEYCKALTKPGRKELRSELEALLAQRPGREGRRGLRVPGCDSAPTGRHEVRLFVT
jgi:hypothetical protein